MSLSSRFTIREEATPALLELLSETTLGTNGALYRHLDTPTRVLEADNPLFLSVERDGKVQGNVTFCRRGDRWYVRYFVFSGQKQAAMNGQHAEKSKSILKQEILHFYEEVFDGKYGPSPDLFYAYIDPNNERSRWQALQFGFRSEAQLITQNFSRVNPKENTAVRRITEAEILKYGLSKTQESHAYFVPNHTKSPVYYGMFNSKDGLIAFAGVTRANWVIERLPGTIGGILAKIVPFIPRLRKIIKPKNHSFLVPEAVWVKGNDSRALTSFFEGILAIEQLNMLVWWVDRREPLWRDTKHDIDWGLLHGLTAQTLVDVMVLRKNTLRLDELKTKPVFVSGWDMV